MKATVMESRDGRAVILKADGTFQEIKGTYETGEIIEYTEKAEYRSGKHSAGAGSRRSLMRTVTALAASLLLVFGVWTYSYQNLMVYATVTIDGDTPIQLELNRKNEVLRVEVLGESDPALENKLNESDIRGKSIEEAVEVLFVIEETGGGLDLSSVKVTCKDHEKRSAITEKIRTSAAQFRNGGNSADAEENSGSGGQSGSSEGTGKNGKNGSSQADGNGGKEKADSQDTGKQGKNSNDTGENKKQKDSSKDRSKENNGNQSKPADDKAEQKKQKQSGDNSGNKSNGGAGKDPGESKKDNNDDQAGSGSNGDGKEKAAPGEKEKSGDNGKGKDDSGKKHDNDPGADAGSGAGSPGKDPGDEKK